MYVDISLPPPSSSPFSPTPTHPHTPHTPLTHTLTPTHARWEDKVPSTIRPSCSLLSLLPPSPSSLPYCLPLSPNFLSLFLYYKHHSPQLFTSHSLLYISLYMSLFRFSLCRKSRCRWFLLSLFQYLLIYFRIADNLAVVIGPTVLRSNNDGKTRE